MAKRDFLQAKGFYLVTFLLILFSMQPLNLFGQEDKPEKTSNIIEIKGNLISLDVKDTDLSEVLKEIEKRTGIKITIGKELIGKKITKSFKNLDVERALRIILGEDYVFVFLKEKDKFVLKEVKAGAAIGSELSKGKMITIEIAYGKGKEEVGAVDEGEGALIGPKSFAVDDAGNIYILDTVNNRVQIFSPRGEYLSAIPLKGGIFAEDITVDKQGFIYIYNGKEEELHQYNKDGNIIKSINIDTSRWDSRGPMQIINDEIYVKGSGIGDVLIGRIVDGLLTSPPEEELKKPAEKGVYGLSGRRYMTGLRRYEEGKIEVIDKDGTTSKTISFPLKGIVSLGFIGEDNRGNLYIETERDESGKLVVEMHNFNSNGDYVNTIQMPEVGSHFWAIKSILVSKNGNIYQFIRKEDKAKLCILSSESN